MVELVFLIAAPILLLAFGMPIFLVFLAAAVLASSFYLGMPLQALTTAFFGSLDSLALLAVPLFILAGDIMARGGIAQRLIEFMGRMCYRSWAPGLNPNVNRVRADSTAYLENILRSAHGSVLERDDKNTIHVFGEYADVYDIRQAVEDEATRPLYYEPHVIRDL